MSRKDFMINNQEISICEEKDIDGLIMFTIGNNIEFSTITSLFQALFVIDHAADYFLGLNCDEQTLEDKIKSLLYKYKYPSKIPGPLLLDSLCAFIPKDLTRFGASPIQLLEFIIARLQTIRYPEHSNRPGSIFSFDIKGAVTFKLLSSRLKSSEDWLFCIEEELGTLETSSILFFQIDWNKRPSTESIATILRYIPLEIQHRRVYSLKSFIAFNGCFYYSFVRINDKWILFEEFGYKKNLRWLEVAWILANRIMYPILVIYEKNENYKEINKNMTEIDWDKLKRYSKFAGEQVESDTRLWIERINREKSFKSYIDERSNLSESKSEFRCKQCLNLIKHNEYRCSECRAVDWNKFYEIKNKEKNINLPNKSVDNFPYRNRSVEGFEEKESLDFKENKEAFPNRKIIDERDNLFSKFIPEKQTNSVKSEYIRSKNGKYSWTSTSNSIDDSNQIPRKIQPLRSKLTWTCNSCNFQNSLKLFICSVCQKPRSPEAHQEILTLTS
ncbi:unnamed protein product [Blepharisma stoltei]|uniref:RanBP2-type domain-containing protein n=1 Tax=Blepharisma stoltei TaxID=1481888 RepID=A0AAU9IBX2_9CILI|nr:unnamed protein product [Blepharisma stoltei]